MSVTAGDLPAIDASTRLDGLRARAAECDLTALLITNLVNVRWLSGFTGSNGTLVVLPDRAVLVTDGRYRERAADEVAAVGAPVDVIAEFTVADQRSRIVETLSGVTEVGAESKALTHQLWGAFAKDLPLRPADGLVEEGRRSKDPAEIARIEAACRAADAALAEVAPLLGDGMTEADVRMELEYRMRRHGADGPSYDTIVASGPQHAARPHHEASHRMIVDGDTVVIDVGGLVDGYHSDMTRSYVIGEPNAQHTELYDFLLSVQLAGMAAVSAGTAASDVDLACRSMIDEAGYGDWFLHSTGHGVGLLIHEDPFESRVSTQQLRVGDVVTVEPGLYRVGFGGFRIEDLLEVTETGCRPLTASPKESPCLPSPPTI